ncbi:hypothetical protein MHBO_001920, partial [Bonamia ostreae]
KNLETAENKLEKSEKTLKLSEKDSSRKSGLLNSFQKNEKLLLNENNRLERLSTSLYDDNDLLFSKIVESEKTDTINKTKTNSLAKYIFGILSQSSSIRKSFSAESKKWVVDLKKIAGTFKIDSFNDILKLEKDVKEIENNLITEKNLLNDKTKSILINSENNLKNVKKQFSDFSKALLGNGEKSVERLITIAKNDFSILLKNIKTWNSKIILKMEENVENIENHKKIFSDFCQENNNFLINLAKKFDERQNQIEKGIEKLQKEIKEKTGAENENQKKRFYQIVENIKNSINNLNEERFKFNQNLAFSVNEDLQNLSNYNESNSKTISEIIKKLDKKQ